MADRDPLLVRVQFQRSDHLAPELPQESKTGIQVIEMAMSSTNRACSDTMSAIFIDTWPDVGVVCEGDAGKNS